MPMTFMQLFYQLTNHKLINKPFIKYAAFQNFNHGCVFKYSEIANKLNQRLLSNNIIFKPRPPIIPEPPIVSAPTL